MNEFGYRENIIEHLEVISNPAKQISVGLDEIICGWFDDLYLPTDDPKLFNPGVFEQGLKDFNSCFTNKELKALKSFNEYFKMTINEIDTSLPMETIQKNPKWITLGDEATRTLKELGPHPTSS